MSAAELAGLERKVRHTYPGFRLTLLETTPSTQDVVRRAAREGAAEGFSCMAGSQTAGRGRQDRRWLAAPGTALLGSILLRPPPSGIPWVPLAAGLAMRSAVVLLSGYDASVKWPNDLMAGSRKLAGVLCEVEPLAPGPGPAVVVGVGVNLRVDAFPEPVRGASLHELCDEAPPAAALFAAFVTEMGLRIGTLAAAGARSLRGEWLRHASGLGEVVTARSAWGEVTGIAEDIDLDGALIIRTGRGAERVLAGDVHIGAGG